VHCHDDVDSGEDWAETEVLFLVVLCLIPLTFTMMAFVSMVLSFSFAVVSILVVASWSEVIILVPQFVAEHSVGLSSSVPFFIVSFLVMVIVLELLIFLIFESFQFLLLAIKIH